MNSTQSIAATSLINVEKINSWIIVDNFPGNPMTIISSCYRTTNVFEETDVAYFYNDIFAFNRFVLIHNIRLF